MGARLQQVTAAGARCNGGGKQYAHERMTEIPFHYLPVPTTTWVYLSSLLAIALYFKFSRLWSVRNLDLILLILMAPGLLLVEYGRGPGGAVPKAADVEYMGYIWLFVTSG